MARKIVSACALVVSLSVVTPALAQTPVWSPDRPDGHAPGGVMADYTLQKGEIYVAYRYSREDFEGTLVGTTPFFSDDVLDFFSVAPLTLDREIHEVELRWGLSDYFTAAVSMPFVLNKMWNVTEDDEFYETRSNDIGDLSIRLLFDLFEIDQYRMHLMLGSTLPSGENQDTDQTPFSGTGQDVLPYAMQAGTGPVDFLGGLGFTTQNEVASVGAHANVAIRPFNNEQDYRRGDAFEFTAWGAYNLNEWMSVSARVLYQSEGETEGADPGTDPLVDPGSNPLA